MEDLERYKNATFFNPKNAIEEEEEENFLSDLDFIKFLIVAKKNLFWIALIFILAFFCAFIFIRYTEPLFQSSAILKLEIQKKSNTIDLNPTDVNAYRMSDLSGEIELIKSNLVLEKVAEKLDIDVIYHAKGKILNEERYKTSPFEVDWYEVINDAAYNSKYTIQFVDNKQFKWVDENEKEANYFFGETVITPNLKFSLKLKTILTEDLISQKFYFMVASKSNQLRYLLNNLQVEVLNPDAGTLKLSFTDHHAQKAKDVIATIDSVYLIEGLADKYKSSEQTISYLQEHLKENEHNMEMYENDIQRFIVKNKTNDIKAEVLKNISLLEKLDKELLILKQKLSKIDEVFDLISSDKDLQDFVIINADLNLPQVSELVSKYNELRKQHELLMLSNKESTMVVRLNNMELTNLKKQSIKIISDARARIIEQSIELNKEKIRLEEAVFSATPKDNDFKKSQRMYSFYERLYLLAFDKKIEFEMTKASTVPSFKVLAQPTVAKMAIYPIKQNVYVYVSIVAAILGLILIVIQYFLHNTIDNLGELEKGTIAPVLGYIPRYVGGDMQFSRLIIDKSPKGPITEALRTIRTNIEFLLPNKAQRLISVTSTIGGEGKTFVSINLAGVIALSGQKVVIIDLDMRKPKIHRAFGDENEMGVSTLLIGKSTIDECIKPTSLTNLSYISSGPIPPNPSELIISKEFTEFLEALKQKFDTIILDSPPSGLVTDAVLIMQKVDLPIYVVRAEYSKKGFEKNANRLIIKNNFKKLSVILNDFSNLSGYGYGYKYGYGYGYGYYAEDSKNGTISSILVKIRSFFRKK